MSSLSESLVVRDAVLGDANTLVTFNLALSEDSNDKKLDRKTLERGLHRALSSSMCRYFIAEHEGKPIGCMMVTYELTDWEDGVIWWLQSVYVRPEARGRGVIDALYRHVTDTARRDPDARAVKLYVIRENERAIRAYTRLGMKRTHYDIYEAGL